MFVWLPHMHKNVLFCRGYHVIRPAATLVEELQLVVVFPGLTSPMCMHLETINSQLKLDMLKLTHARQLTPLRSVKTFIRKNIGHTINTVSDKKILMYDAY